MHPWHMWSLTLQHVQLKFHSNTKLSVSNIFQPPCWGVWDQLLTWHAYGRRWWTAGRLCVLQQTGQIILVDCSHTGNFPFPSGFTAGALAPEIMAYFSHLPFSSTASTQAPLASSSSTTTFKPLRAATWRGLKKRQHRVSTAIHICMRIWHFE